MKKISKSTDFIFTEEEKSVLAKHIKDLRKEMALNSSKPKEAIQAQSTQTRRSW